MHFPRCEVPLMMVCCSEDNVCGCILLCLRVKDAFVFVRVSTSLHMCKMWSCLDFQKCRWFWSLAAGLCFFLVVNSCVQNNSTPLESEVNILKITFIKVSEAPSLFCVAQSKKCRILEECNIGVSSWISTLCGCIHRAVQASPPRTQIFGEGFGGLG